MDLGGGNVYISRPEELTGDDPRLMVRSRRDRRMIGLRTLSLATTRYMDRFHRQLAKFTRLAPMALQQPTHGSDLGTGRAARLESLLLYENSLVDLPKNGHLAQTEVPYLSAN